MVPETLVIRNIISISFHIVVIWGKVMFSKACVILSTGVGVGGGSYSVVGLCPLRTETPFPATAVGGTRPTGMHSCFDISPPPYSVHGIRENLFWGD